MSWQDWVISICGIIIIFSLIPTIKGEDKPALSTCIVTAIIITIVATTMLTLSLWLSAIVNYIIAVGWYILMYQQYKKYKKTKNK